MDETQLPGRRLQALGQLAQTNAAIASLDRWEANPVGPRPAVASREDLETLRRLLEDVLATLEPWRPDGDLDGDPPASGSDA